MKRKVILVFFVVLLLCATVSAQEYRELKDFELDTVQLLKTRNDSEIKDIRVTIPVGKQPLGWILYGIVFDTGVQFGVEIGPDDTMRDYVFSPYLHVMNGSEKGQFVVSRYSPDDYAFSKKFEVPAQNARLEDYLDRLVEKIGDFGWEINDGVVNIRPKGKRDPMVAEFLDTKISHFWFPAGIQMHEIYDTVKALPEFKKNGITVKGFGGTWGHGKKFTLKEPVSLRDLTVRELLNKLAKLNQCGWFVGPSLEPDKDDGRITVYLGI